MVSWGSRRLCLPCSTRLRSSALNTFSLWLCVTKFIWQLRAVGWKGDIRSYCIWGKGFQPIRRRPSFCDIWIFAFWWVYAILHEGFATLSVFLKKRGSSHKVWCIRHLQSIILLVWTLQALAHRRHNRQALQAMCFRHPVQIFWFVVKIHCNIL